MATLAETLHNKGYKEVILGMSSPRKIEGAQQSLRRSLQGSEGTIYLPAETGSFPVNSINPELFAPEPVSDNPAEVSAGKAEVLQANLPERHHIIFTADIVTVYAASLDALDRNQGLPLHRIARHFEDKDADIQKQIETFKDVVNRERATTVALCCNGNFWIEWCVAITVTDSNGLNMTYETTARAFFNQLEESLVTDAFSYDEAELAAVTNNEELERIMYKVPGVKIGPRLPFAEMTDRYAQQVHQVENGEARSISTQELIQLVVGCELPPHAVLALLEKLDETELVSV